MRETEKTTGKNERKQTKKKERMRKKKKVSKQELNNERKEKWLFIIINMNIISIL